MKFQSTILSDAGGKLNGSVFTRNRFASVVRNKTSPNQPNSQFSSEARQRLAALAQQFRELTPEQIEAWNNATDNYQRTNVFGQPYKLSGLNLFCSLNANLVNIGKAVITNPPSPQSFNPFTFVVTTLTPSEVKLTISPKIVTGHDEILIIKATASVSKGRSFLRTQFRQVYVGYSDNSGEIDISTDYISRLGNPVNGMRIGFQIRVINEVTGQASQTVEVSSIV